MNPTEGFDSRSNHDNERRGTGKPNTDMTTRHLTRTALRAGLIALSINLLAAAPGMAGSSKNINFPDIRIKNFGQMDERFFRGAQPEEQDYKGLAALGIKTIIDLRDDPTRYEKIDAEAAGMRYVNIPMSDSSRPRDEQIEQFLKLVNDPATGRFFVHCAGGRHRTGVMGAVYRMNHDGWDFDQAYKEMKAYDFYTRWGHGALKDYVHDYFGNLESIEVSAGKSSGVNR
ncbi:MAG TPA: tyrosine-protein phosphatase [Blastocatellia bacterium]|nr:tyrosine-protein phosphatase [Blastocatellia bacterium]